MRIHLYGLLHTKWVCNIFAFDTQLQVTSEDSKTQQLKKQKSANKQESLNVKSTELSSAFNDFFDSMEGDKSKELSKPIPDKIGTTGFLKSKARQRVAAEEISRLKAVVSNPDYQKNPYSAIHEHYKAVTK